MLLSAWSICTYIFTKEGMLEQKLRRDIEKNLGERNKTSLYFIETAE